MVDGKVRDDDTFLIHRALNHPLRVRIIEVLGEKGSMSFTDFKNALNVRVGTLYYHFDILGRLIAQDEQKKYVLTDHGKKTLELLRVESRVVSVPKAQVSSSRIGVYFRNLLLPTGFLSYMYRNPGFGAIGAVMTMILGVWISFQTKLEPILFFFDRAPAQNLLIPFELISSWIVVFVLSDSFSVLLFKRRGDDRLLLLGTTFSFGPVLLFAAVAYLDFSLRSSYPLLGNQLIERALLTVTQSWSFVVLTSAIAASKGLSIDKAAVIALIIAYFNIMLLFVLGKIG